MVQSGFKRQSYDPYKRMSVKFSDDRGLMEEALHFSGPCQEFLRLLMEALARSFEGREGHLNLALSASEEEGQAKLGDILSFATGSNMVPPIGFSLTPSLTFHRRKYPMANTCSNCLTIPLYRNYEEFKQNMDFALRNTQGFGME